MEPGPQSRVRPRAVAWLLKLLVLAVSSIACAYAAGFAAFATHHWSLPPTDGAYDQTVMETWSDPFVQDIALFFMWLGAALGFALSCWLLWRTRLARSIPIVFTITVFVAAATGPLVPLGILMSLAAGAASMVWCRFRFAEQQPGPAAEAR